jgi:hypothetical protein
MRFNNAQTSTSNSVYHAAYEIDTFIMMANFGQCKIQLPAGPYKSTPIQFTM